MRVSPRSLLLCGLLLRCGGDEQPATTSDPTTVATGNMTASASATADPPTTGPGESTAASDTTPTSDPSTSQPAPGAPVFLSLKTNVTEITAGDTVIFTAILTDPDGVDDIVGGELSDATGVIGYGPFVAAGQEGTYSLSLSWDAIHQADPIQFEATDLPRTFRAEFYDQAANKVTDPIDLTLTCAEGSACDGVCTDITADAAHCGSCSGLCDGGCDAGQCAPKWGECIQMSSGFDTCDTYCNSVSEACVENGCGEEKTVRAYGNMEDCFAETLYATVAESCTKPQSFGIGRQVVQCCCTDTK